MGILLGSEVGDSMPPTGDTRIRGQDTNEKEGYPHPLYLLSLYPSQRAAAALDLADARH